MTRNQNIIWQFRSEADSHLYQSCYYSVSLNEILWMWSLFTSKCTMSIFWSSPLGDGVNRLGLNLIGRTSYKWHWAKERSRQARLHFVFVVPKTLKFPYWCNLVVVWSNHYAIECKLHIENIFLINYTKQEDYLRNSPQGESRECRVLQPDSIRNNYICRIH